ncbi:MAG TPA: zf-TFIIB domain-containing protein [Polyangia bacterium]
MDGTSRCPHCHALTAASAARCAQCGLLVREKHPRDPDTPITCPACGTQAEFAYLGDIQIDLCPGCDGVWFDDGELTALPGKVSDRELAKGAVEFLTGLPPVAGHTRRSSYLQCPVCASHLAPRNYCEASGILTDRCDGCGTWVDHDNLIKILNLISSAQLADVNRRAAQLRREQRPADVMVGRPWPSTMGMDNTTPVPIPPSSELRVAAGLVGILLDVLGFF